MKKSKIIFLDRDGVINKDPIDTAYGYVTRWKEFKFLRGAKRAIRELTEAGYKIYIISNQAGIAKGYFTLDDLKSVTKKMLKRIEDSGGKIAGVFYCPHRGEDNCDCRKPKAGLFRKALGKKKTVLRDTFFIGDKIADVQAGHAAGLESILVLCGKESLENKGHWRDKPDYIKRDLLDAVNWILKTKGTS